MYIPRLLLLSLLMCVCVAPVVAQSPSDNEPGSFYSEPLDVLPHDAIANLRLNQIQPPIEINRLHSPYAKPKSAEAGEHDWTITVPSRPDKRALTGDTTCLSIRSYRVTRDDPQSDATRLVGYSTCQPATKFQVKEAGQRQEIVPH